MQQFTSATVLLSKCDDGRLIKQELMNLMTAMRASAKGQ
jgi:hypothetical protein